MKKKIVIITFGLFLLFISSMLISCSSKEHDGKFYSLEIYELAKDAGYTGTYDEWLLSIDNMEGLPGKDGREVEIILEDNMLKYRYVGDINWKDLFSITILNGKNAYDLAKEAGYTGTLNEYLDSLIGKNGKSAYELAKEAGYTKSLEEWLESLKGENGLDGLPGIDGASGASAYDLAVSGGYTGSLSEWISSLKGIDGVNGASAYDLAVNGGYTGSLEEWISSLKGAKGDSAYELYKKSYPAYTKTESEWIADLVNGNLSNYITHTVKYDLNGGVATSDFVLEETVEDLKTAKLTTPTKAGYTFMGWYTGSSVNDGIVTYTYKIDKDYNLIARWSENNNTPYKVIYNVAKVDNSGYDVLYEEDLEGTTDKTYIIDKNDFLGYTLKEKVEFVVKGDGSSIVNVYYERNTYQITFMTTIGLNNDVRSFKYEETIEYPNTDKADAQFLGWFIGENVFNDEIMPAKDLVLVGYWDFYETVGLNFELTSQNVYKVISYTGVDTNVYIPSVHNGLPVVEVGAEAFLNNTAIEKIVIPNSVTKLNQSMFKGCSNLIELEIPFISQNPNTTIRLSYFFGNSYDSTVIPTTLKKITITNNPVEKEAFYNCSNIEEVIIQTGTYIGNFAFYGCTNLSKVVLPEGLVNIGSDCFRLCKSLKSIELPNSLEIIGYNAFLESAILKINSDIEGVINFPESLKEINTSAFAGCSYISNINFNDGLQRIGSNAFENLPMLTEIIIPNSVITINISAFIKCNSVSQLTVPFVGENRSSSLHIGCMFGTGSFNYAGSYIPDVLSKVTITDAKIIPSSGFRYCSNFTEIIINEGIERIDDYAFSNCTSLKEIIIPTSAKKIGISLFNDCSNLEKVTANNEMTEIPDNMFYNCKNLKSFNGEVLELNLININKIGNNAFNNVLLVNKVTLCDDLTYIGDNAFYNCSNIISLDLPDKITYIGNSAFRNLNKITSISFPDSLITMGNNPLIDCSRLEELYVPFVGPSIDNVSIIGYLFGTTSYNYISSYYPSTLTKITINYLKEIPDYFAYNCQYIKELVINNGVTKIGNNAFYNCVLLESFNVLETVKSIGYNAFNTCSSLQEIYLPTSITELNNSTFNNCSSLKRVNSDIDYVINIPDNITLLYDRVFYGCKLIKEINLPITLTGIGEYCFAYMSELKELVIPDEIITIGLGIISNTNQLEKVKVPFIGYTINSPAIFSYLYINTSPDYQNAYVSNTLKEIIITKGEVVSKQFYNLQNIESVKLNENITTISSYMFYNCTKLTDIVIPDNVNEIGESAFKSCSNLETINIPAGVTAISESTFAYCSLLKGINSEDKIILSSNIVSIGESAFLECRAIEEVVIEGAITVFETNVFYNCINLIRFCGEDNVLVIPSSIQEIKSRAFYNCRLFTSIIKGDDIIIAKNAFESCNF